MIKENAFPASYHFNKARGNTISENFKKLCAKYSVKFMKDKKCIKIILTVYHFSNDSLYISMKSQILIKLV